MPGAADAILTTASGVWDASDAARSVATDSSPAVGDVLLAVWYVDFSNAADAEAPTGTWELIADAGSESNSRVAFYKSVVTTAGVQTVTLSGSNDSETAMVVYVLDPAFSFVDAVGTATGTGTSQAAPSVVTSNDDELLICAWATGNFGSENYTAVPGGMTQDYLLRDSGTFLAALAMHSVVATAGATGAQTATAASPQFDWAAASVTMSATAPPTPPVQVISQGAAVTGTTSITTAAYGTGWAAGDLIVYTVASGQTSEGTPTVSGFDLIGSLSGGGGTFSGGTGPRRLSFFTRVAQTGDTTPTISLTSGNNTIAASTVLRHDTGLDWDTAVAAFGAETTAGTAWTQALTSDPGLEADDVLLLGCAIRDSSTSSAEGITATGATFGSVTERTDQTSETGNDCSLHVSTVTVATGPNSATPTRTATHSSSETGVMGVLRVRAVSSGGTDATATPSVVSGTAAVPSVTMHTGMVAAVSVVAAVASVLTPMISNGSNATAAPAVVTATTTVASPTMHAGSVASPSAITRAATIGSVTVASFRYITSISSNGRYFLDQDGNPMLVRGESPWAMFTKLSSSEMDTYLENRAGYGCNFALVSMIGSVANGGPADTGATYDGVLPFTGGDPTAFNSTYWSRMDSYIAKARDLGITLMIFPMDGWNTTFGSVVFNPGDVTNTQCQTYGQTLATRYLSYPNIVWSFGGDYNEDSTIDARYNACLTGIRAAGDDRPCTIQLLYETSESHNSSFWEPKVDWDFIYTYYVTYKGVSDGYNYTWLESPTTRPALFSEGAYENSFSPHNGTDEALRRQACWALTSGSPGELTGQEGVWNFESDWATLLDTTAADQMKAIRDTFEALDWWTLIPDDSSQLVTAGRGTRITTDSATFPVDNNYVTAGRAADGTLAVIFLPNASSAITVDMTKIGTNPTATWVDPTSGATSTATVGSSYSKGDNAVGDTDWLLILTGDAGVTATPSTVAATAAVPAPTVRISKTATPSAVTATATVPAPTVRLSKTAAPSVAAATATVPAPTIRLSKTAAPSTVAGVVSVPAPTVQLSMTAVPSTVAAVAAVPTPTVQAGSNVLAHPSVVAGIAAVAVPSLSTGEIVSVTAVAQTVAIPAPTINTGSVVAPAAVAGATVVGSPSISVGGSATVAPTTVTAAAAIPGPTVSAGQVATPAAVAGTASVATPIATGGTAATPATVARVVVIPAPTVTGTANSTAAPAAVHGVAVVPLPTVNAGGLVPPTGIVRAAVIPTPTVVLSVSVSGTAIHAAAAIGSPLVVSSAPVPGTASAAVGSGATNTDGTQSTASATAAHMTVPRATPGG